MIGGERGKCRPYWIGVFCDWSRAREREAMFAQIREVSIKVTSPEAEVKTTEAEVKMSRGVVFIENLPERVCYKRERGPGPSVTAGVPFFFLVTQ